MRGEAEQNSTRPRSPLYIYVHERRLRDTLLLCSVESIACPGANGIKEFARPELRMAMPLSFIKVMMTPCAVVPFAQRPRDRPAALRSARACRPLDPQQRHPHDCSAVPSFTCPRAVWLAVERLRLPFWSVSADKELIQSSGNKTLARSWPTNRGFQEEMEQEYTPEHIVSCKNFPGFRWNPWAPNTLFFSWTFKKSVMRVGDVLQLTRLFVILLTPDRYNNFSMFSSGYCTSKSSKTSSHKIGGRC